MATVSHAGMKRSFFEMRTDQSAPSSREASPHRRSTSQRLTAPSSPVDASAQSKAPLTPLPRTASFDPDVSIVLIGIRGSGRSSLGVLAATAYNRRLVDSERVFTEVTGQTTQSYRKANGTAAYYSKHREVLQRLLSLHDKSCVITCSFSDLESHGAIIIQDYARRHPVIHVTRDVKSIQAYLQVWTEARVKKLLYAGSRLLRDCANYEYFNLAEVSHAEYKDRRHSNDRLTDSAAATGPFLTLKRVERDFLRTLYNIIGDSDRAPSHHSAYPLSQVRTHSRKFTLCARATLESVRSGGVDLNELQIGADAVTLVIPSDLREQHGGLTDIAEGFALLRRSTMLPVVIDLSSTAPCHGHSNFPAIANHCLALAPEYIVINLDRDIVELEQLLSAKGRTSVIGSRHFDPPPPARWNDPACLSSYTYAAKLGCDVVNITMPALEMSDNFAVGIFRQEVPRLGLGPRLAAYNTGQLGRMSRCFNEVMTPISISESIDIGSTPDLGQDIFTAKEAIHSLFATFVYEPLHFFIYGGSVSYSLSPAMHNAAYQACGMAHKYGTHSAPSLDDFKRLSKDPDFGGAAVVQPYKVEVLPLLQGLSTHAKAIGSVNTVIPLRKLTGDGHVPSELEMMSQSNRTGPVVGLYGHNTDWIGIRACLRRGLSPANTVRTNTTGMVCGAGGQARAAVYAMLSLGVRHVFICNRTVSKASDLVDYYNRLIEDNEISEIHPKDSAHTRVHLLQSFEDEWASTHRQPSLIVSSIPTQTADGTAVNFQLPEKWLHSPTGGVAIELAYRPMVTPVVTQMRDLAHKGWIFFDGFDILPEQAFAQFELFTGRRAPRKVMRDEILEQFQAQENERNTNEASMDPNPPAT